MNQNNNNLALLSSAPVPQALLALGVPVMIGMLVNALYNLADAYFVGSLGESPMGAISVVFPLGQVVTGLGLMFGNGAASCLSRLLGRGAQAEADRVASTALYSSMLLGAAVICVASLCLRPLLRALGATETILPYAVTYGRIYVLSCIFNVFNVTMNNIVASEGAARTAMCALLLGAVLNLGLDPLCIHRLGWGVAGAAIATAVSQAASTLVYLLYLLRGKSCFGFSVHLFCPSREVLAGILKIGVPTLTFQLLTGLSIALINRAAQGYGDAAIAALGAVSRITAMGTLVVFGFLKGFQPLAGFSYGAGQFGRLRQAIRCALAWSTGFCVLAGGAAALFARPLIAQFAGNNAEMLALGQKALTASGLSFLLFGFTTVYSSLLLALGRGRAGFVLGACRQGICFVPAILLLPALWGVDGILYAQPVADLLAAAAAAWVAVRLHRELNVAEQAALARGDGL